MKKFYSLLTCLTAGCCFAGNPLQFPEYRQELKITYRTPEQSKNADVALLSLPGGKRLAYTSRWDDTNRKNTLMSELLKKHGMKGTFMLNWRNFKAQGQKLLADGHAIGNHTEYHYWLPLTTPNRIFYEIALHQVRLESELQTTVVSFVYPFGRGRSLFNDFAGTCAKIFDCSNLYVFPFYWKGANKYFRRPKNSMFATTLFSSHDRRPTHEYYKQKMANALKRVDPDFQRITHGIHVWMTPQGFKELDKAFAETSKNPDLVFLTDNEYGAYRYSWLHAGLRKKQTAGKNVTYELTRFHPGHLGSEIPLTLKIDPAPQKVEVNGVPLKKDPNGFWLLSHDRNKKMPATYEWLKDTNAASQKIAGLKFELIPDNDLKRFRVKLTNQTGKALQNLTLQLSLPPRWIKYRQIVSAARLDNGKSQEWSFDTSKINNDPDFSHGTYWFIARLDCDGARIYRTISREGTGASHGEIQTSIRRMINIPKAAVTKDIVQKLSYPGTLEPIQYQGKTYEWKKYISKSFNRYSFDFRGSSFPDKVSLAVAEFSMPEDGEIELFIYRDMEVHCNGKFVGKKARKYKVQAKKGRNRLYLPDAAYYDSIILSKPAKFIDIVEK